MATPKLPRPKKERPQIPSFVADVMSALKPGRGHRFRAKDPDEAAKAVLAALVLSLSKAGLDRDLGSEVTRSATMGAAAMEIMNPTTADAILNSNGVKGAKGKTKLPAWLVAQRAALGSIGTHGGKIPDARLGLGVMCPEPSVFEATHDAPGLHTSSAALTFPLSGSDAQVMSGIRFLGMPISVGEAAASTVAEILADREGAVCGVLEGSLDPGAWKRISAIGDAARIRLAHPDVPDRVEVGLPQILFPVAGGYHALAPLYPYGLGAEVSRRLRSRQSGDRGETRERLAVRVVHVGGSKPQNAGLLPNFLSGEMPRLLALPPRPEADMRRDALRRLRSGTVPLPASIARKASIDALLSALSAGSGNARARARIDACIRSLVEDTLWAVSLLAEQRVTAEASGIDLLGGLPVPKRNLLAARIAGLPTREGAPSMGELEGVADDIARVVCGKLSGEIYVSRAGRVPLSIDDIGHVRVANAALLVLEEFAR